MFRKFLNSLLENGLLFATLFLHLMSAAVTTMTYLIVGIIIKWLGKHT